MTVKNPSDEEKKLLAQLREVRAIRDPELRRLAYLRICPLPGNEPSSMTNVHQLQQRQEKA